MSADRPPAARRSLAAGLARHSPAGRPLDDQKRPARKRLNGLLGRAAGQLDGRLIAINNAQIS